MQSDFTTEGIRHRLKGGVEEGKTNYEIKYTTSFDKRFYILVFKTNYAPVGDLIKNIQSV